MNQTVQASTRVQNLGSFVWSTAEILRGDFKQSEYGKVILPFIVMRRLDCILEATKPAVVEAEKSLPDGIDDETRDMILFGAAGDNIRVYNTSRFTFASVKGQDPGQLHDNLIDYITRFSPNARDIFLDKFRFTEALKRLKDGGILWQVFERFCTIDLHPNQVSNIEMGYLFEDLIRRFSEISNETAGEHFTPREVIRLIVELLLAHDHEALTGTGIIRTVYDPACGTGGMLALTEEAMTALNPKIRVELFGQELNGESFGICKSDMLVTGHNPEQIAFGNTLTDDAHPGKTFHYMLSNPPYGVDWKKYQDPIRAEHETKGFDGRFGPGLPRISDGQLLFLLHMISKMRNDEQGSRIGIVMNGSPLFSGGAGSGESETRRWMFEKDWVEAIVAMPTDLFYNTRLHAFKIEQKEAGSASLAAGDTIPLSPIKEFAAKPYTAEEEISLSAIIRAFNDRHGTQFTKEDFLRFEQVNHEIMDEDMVEMLRNNPADVVFSAFSQAFFKGAIRMFQRDNEMKNIVLSDPRVRDQAIRHFFGRALREARE